MQADLRNAAGTKWRLKKIPAVFLLKGLICEGAGPGPWAEVADGSCTSKQRPDQEGQGSAGGGGPALRWEIPRSGGKGGSGAGSQSRGQQEVCTGP